MKISVIIATYNRYKTLSGTLNSLCQQKSNEGFNYEIIVVDNNSKDETKDTIKSFIKENPKIRYLFELKQGISNARNTGINNAKGEILAFTDDDVLLDTSWILNIYNFSKECNFDAIGGKVLPIYPPNTPKWIKECKDILSGPIVNHDYGEEIREYNKEMFPFIGANMIIKNKVLKDVGSFDPNLGAGKGSLGEDTELFIRMQNAGKKIYYNPNILILHPVEKYRMNYSYIAKWSFLSGKYMANQNSKTKPEKLTCYWGVPRYLLLEFIKNIYSFVFTIGNNKKFIKHLRNSFISIGMICGYYQEYRLNINDKKSS